MAEQKMTDAARDARNAYYRAWRARNPEKVRNSNKRYWSKKAAELAAAEKEAESNAGDNENTDA